MTKDTHLTTTPNVPDIDDVYERLLKAHSGLGEKESQALNARLVLILANHIGDKAVLEQAIALAVNAAKGRGEN